MTANLVSAIAIAAVVTAGTLVGGGILAYLIGEAIKKQGEKRKYFATLPQQGRFYFWMVGGRLEEIVENMTDWKLECINDRWLFIRTSDQEELDFWGEYLGVKWIGLYGSIKEFENFQWVEFRQRRDSDGNLLPEYEAATREKNSFEFLRQFTYSVPMSKIDLLGNEQASANALATVWVLDPEKAFLDNKNWVSEVSGVIQSTIRGMATTRTFQEFKEFSAAPNQYSEFCRQMLSINGLHLSPNGDPDYDQVTPGGLFQVYGVVIWNVNLQDLEPTGELAESLRKKEKERLDGEAKVTKEELAARALVVAAQGRMDASERDAIAQRNILEQTIGYAGSVPGGDRMYTAQQVSREGSSVSVWVEGGADIKPTLPLPVPPPAPPKPERVGPPKDNPQP